MDANLCPVCGWDRGEPGWVAGAPIYLICGCCAAESGVDDLSARTADLYRRLWVARGHPFTVAEEAPATWSRATVSAQLVLIGIDLEADVVQVKDAWWRRAMSGGLREL